MEFTDEGWGRKEPVDGVGVSLVCARGIPTDVTLLASVGSRPSRNEKS